MITINKEGRVIRISGHAGFNDYGKDIVCASVSSICYCTINALKKLGKNIEVEDDKDMIIKVIDEDEISNALIDNMIELLTALEHDYPKNIKVKESNYVF